MRANLANSCPAPYRGKKTTILRWGSDGKAEKQAPVNYVEIVETQ